MLKSQLLAALKAEIQSHDFSLRCLQRRGHLQVFQKEQYCQRGLLVEFAPLSLS